MKIEYILLDTDTQGTKYHTMDTYTPMTTPLYNIVMIQTPISGDSNSSDIVMSRRPPCLDLNLLTPVPFDDYDFGEPDFGDSDDSDFDPGEVPVYDPSLHGPIHDGNHDMYTYEYDGPSYNSFPDCDVMFGDDF